jgi:hypothetical protein
VIVVSSQRQSTAAVIRVKGVSFNYLQFLWNSIGTIKRTHDQGDFSGALRLATELIGYLPQSIKEEFKEKAAKIDYSLNQIKTGSIPQIRKIPDFYLRGIFKNRLLQNYGNIALKTFIDELTTKLDKIGYMENTKIVAEGDAEAEGSWIYVQDEEKRRGKGKKKKNEAPSGTMD